MRKEVSRNVYLPSQSSRNKRGCCQPCANFDGNYWRTCDADRAYPTDFVSALTDAGYLSALIPEVWRPEPAHFRRRRHSRGNPPFWRQCGGLPCPNVYNGDGFAAWVRCTKATYLLVSPMQSGGCKPWGDRTDKRHRHYRFANHCAP